MSKKEKTEYESIATQHGEFKTKRLAPWYKNRKSWEPVNPKHLLSFIPGTIVEVKVAPGDKVKEGDDLILFKAMKMDSMIQSETEGIVKTVHVVPGDKVPKGFLLLEFE